MRLPLVPLLVVTLATAALGSGCASALVALGLGLERGKANLVGGESSEGIVFLERDPRDAVDTVVLLHGFGGNKDHWTRFAQQLPANVRVVIPDLPGSGESRAVETESYDVASQVARLERFFVENHLAKFHLMGNSLGGLVATAYALAHPERVKSLVLFDPAGITPPEKSETQKLREAGADPLVVRDAADFDRLMKLSFVNPPPVPDFLKGHFAELAARGAPAARKLRADMDAKPRHIEGEISSLKPPTLVVWGDSDEIIDTSAAALWRARVPGHLVVVMRDTGHAPMLERPAESAGLVAVWWRRLSH
jgi:pimeloyl-ACP methyl ester carboxylesterase